MAELDAGPRIISNLKKEAHYSENESVTVADTTTVLIAKKLEKGKQGGFTIYNPTATGKTVTVKLWCTYKDVPIVIGAANWGNDWGQMGSDNTIAAGGTATYAYQGKYKNIGATATVASGTAAGINAYFEAYYP